MKALTFKQFLFENRFFDSEGRYVKSDYTPSWREYNNMGPQRYLNKENNAKLNVLKFIYDSGHEGRSYSEIQRFYYEYGNVDGKRDRMDYDKRGYVDGKWATIRKGKGMEHREYDSKRDRGLGATMLSGRDWSGKPTGILHAHCMKNENGKWVLIDRTLIDLFNDNKAKELGMDDYLAMRDMDVNSGEFLDPNSIDWEDDLSDL